MQSANVSISMRHPALALRARAGVNSVWLRMKHKYYVFQARIMDFKLEGRKLQISPIDFSPFPPLFILTLLFSSLSRSPFPPLSILPSFSLRFFSFLTIPPSLPSNLYSLSPSSIVRFGSLSPILLGNLEVWGSAMSSPSVSGRRPADSFWCILSWKS